MKSATSSDTFSTLSHTDILADDQLLGLEEVENMLQDEETGDQGVDAVTSSWRIRSLAAFFLLVSRWRNKGMPYRQDPAAE